MAAGHQYLQHHEKTMSETENIDDLIQDFEQEGMNNQFLLLFKTSSGLKVLHKTRCTKKLKSQGCSGLASLFLLINFWIRIGNLPTLDCYKRAIK